MNSIGTPQTQRISDVLAHERGVIVVSNHPHLRHAIDHAVKTGTLIAPFRGIYIAPDTTDDFGVRLLALHRADPSAVLMGATAAFLHRPTGRPPVTVCAATHRLRPRPGYAFEDRVVPTHLVARVHGLPVTNPALTAVDLACPDGASLDEALRCGVRLDELWDAYRSTPHRPGNNQRRWLLEDSRDRPWSPAERRAHRALREAKITGWRTNVKIRCGDQTFVGDLAFSAVKLIIEIDGFEHHGTKDAFARDRRRDRTLALWGWHVVRFTAADVYDRPDQFALQVRALVQARAHLIG